MYACFAQGFSIGDLYLSGLLMLNACAILHEKRFLAPCNIASLNACCVIAFCELRNLTWCAQMAGPRWIR